MKTVIISFLCSFALSAQAPQPQPQPNEKFYSVSALDLFPTYSRASYLTTFGKRAPACDPTRLFKTWIDSTADVSDPGNVSIYKQLSRNANGTYALKQYVVPASQAASVNLAGTETFPTYAPADPSAIHQIFFGQTLNNSPNPIYLATFQDAQAVMTAIGGTSVAEEQMNGVTWVYPVTEPRRLYDVVMPNGVAAQNVGMLLYYQLYKSGVGAPGHWDLTAVATKGPVFVPDVYPACEKVIASMPIPARDLLPNESLTLGPLGVPQITRTDLVPPAPAAGGGFTAQDRDTLNQVLTLLQKIMGK